MLAISITKHACVATVHWACIYINRCIRIYVLSLDCHVQLYCTYVAKSLVTAIIIICMHVHRLMFHKYVFNIIFNLLT